MLLRSLKSKDNAMTPETKFQKRVQKFLDSLRSAGLPVWWYKTHGGGYAKAGIPDLCIVCCGCSLWIELKAGKGKPSKIQLERIDQIREARGAARVCYSLREVAAFILVAVDRILCRPGFLAEEFPHSYRALQFAAEATEISD